MEGGKNAFEKKIYIGYYYDLSRASNSEQSESSELQHVEMLMYVNFPKDKEELRRKKIEAMLKKLGGAVQIKNEFDNERQIQEINKELD